MIKLMNFQKTPIERVQHFPHKTLVILENENFMTTLKVTTNFHNNKTTTGSIHRKSAIAPYKFSV